MANVLFNLNFEEVLQVTLNFSRHAINYQYLLCFLRLLQNLFCSIFHQKILKYRVFNKTKTLECCGITKQLFGMSLITSFII